MAISPIFLDPENTDGSAPVGKQMVFELDSPGQWQLTTDDTGVVELLPGGDRGTWTASWGGVALAPGRATITAKGPEGREIVFTLNVVE